jgi:hypothetical protein
LRYPYRGTSAGEKEEGRRYKMRGDACGEMRGEERRGEERGGDVLG